MSVAILCSKWPSKLALEPYPSEVNRGSHDRTCFQRWSVSMFARTSRVAWILPSHGPETWRNDQARIEYPISAALRVNFPKLRPATPHEARIDDGQKPKTTPPTAWLRLALEADRLLVLHPAGHEETHAALRRGRPAHPRQGEPGGRRDGPGAGQARRRSRTPRARRPRAVAGGQGLLGVPPVLRAGRGQQHDQQGPPGQRRRAGSTTCAGTAAPCRSPNSRRDTSRPGWKAIRPGGRRQRTAASSRSCWPPSTMPKQKYDVPNPLKGSKSPRRSRGCTPSPKRTRKRSTARRRSVSGLPLRGDPHWAAAVLRAGADDGR